MIVVSDTTPISSLLKIDKLDILESLFSKVIIPPSVKDELVVGFTVDEKLKRFLSANWVQIVHPKNQIEVKRLLGSLDDGKSEAIVLAKELNTDYLLIDEVEGRKIAKQEGLTIIGTAGILLLAKKKNLIQKLKPELDWLMQSEGFWLSQKIYDQLLDDAGE